VLEEGPNKVNTSTEAREARRTLPTRIASDWYFYGRDQGRAGGDRPRKREACQGSPSPMPNWTSFVTVINDSVVRATINPLDSAHSLPFDALAAGVPALAGVGVAEQMRAPQRIVNAALRATTETMPASQRAASLSSTRVPFGRRTGSGWLRRTKIWLTTTSDAPADVRMAFMAIEIRSHRSADWRSSPGRAVCRGNHIDPLIAQGQSGATTPDPLVPRSSRTTMQSAPALDRLCLR